MSYLKFNSTNKEDFFKRIIGLDENKMELVDKLYNILALYPALSYINLGITILFYILSTWYLLNKINLRSSTAKISTFYINIVELILCCAVIAWGLRFIPPEFIDSVPLRVLMHPRYIATFIFDTIVFLTLFLLLLQIPKLGKYLVLLALTFIYIYILIAFTTFFHIKRLPSAKDFKLGGQILLVSPFNYLMLAVNTKPMQFIIGYFCPLIITIIGFLKIDFNSLRIKPVFSFKMMGLLIMPIMIGVGLWILEKPIKNNPPSFSTPMLLNQNINRLGLLKYQLYLLNSNVEHKTNYKPDILKQQVEYILTKYPADNLKTTVDMPQVILGWASESFMFPERLDPTLINQDQINPTFKKLLKQGVANSVSSCFPLVGGGTVLGESNLLTNLRLTTPKQSHPSLVSYYKSLGYTTIYIHVVADTFYSYQERSKYYGFDEIYLGSYFKAAWGDDKALLSLLKKRISKAITSNEKIFISFIDIGKHGPYRFNKEQRKNLISEFHKTYGSTDEGLLDYIYKSNIVDNYLGDVISFISKQKVPIALMLNADHVPGGFKKEYNPVGDEARYMSEFLFYHNQKTLTIPNGYNYIHQSLVPSLFLKSLSMPLRPIDKYILEGSKTEKTYKLEIMEQLPYDIALGQQVGKPIYELKDKK